MKSVEENKPWAAVALACLLLGHAGVLTGCAGPTRSSGVAIDRDTQRAREFTRRAQAIGPADPAAAADLLRDALDSDPFYAPAHNNLGVLHYRAGRLNSARDAFETARRLLPSDPGPRVNLALVYRAAGLGSEAESQYEQVLETHPDHPAALRGLLVLRTDRGATDAHTRELLERLALSNDPAWSDWAQERQRAIRGRAER